MSAGASPSVLIVDDEFDIRLLVRVLLEASDLDIQVVGEAGDGVEALSLYNRLDPPRVPDVVIIDNRMPGRSGIEVAAEMLEAYPEQQIILFTAYVNREVERESAEVGIRRCIGKTDYEQLPAVVAELSRHPA